MISKKRIRFEKNATVPISKIKKEKLRKKVIRKIMILPTYSNDFKITNQQKLIVNDYFKKDLFTGDYT